MTRISKMATADLIDRQDRLRDVRDAMHAALDILEQRSISEGIDIYALFRRVEDQYVAARDEIIARVGA